MKKAKFFKTLMAIAMIFSQLTFTGVHADEQGLVDVNGTSAVSWTGDIGWGYGTYPQRALETVTLTYSKDVDATNITTDSFKVQDTLYAETGVAASGVDYNNGYLSVDQVEVNGNKITLTVSTLSGSGIFTSSDGNFRRLVSEFIVTQVDEIKDAEGNVISEANTTTTLTQDDIYAYGSDEFNNLILTSETAGNNIYVKYYLPENYDSSKEYPMVIHITGGGQQYSEATPDAAIYGDNNYGVELDIDLAPSTFSINAPEDTIMVTMQCLKSNQPEGYDGSKDANQVVEYFLDHYAVDPDRVYAVGNSQGGIYLSKAVYYRPDLYAAYLPCNTSIVMGAGSAEEGSTTYELCEEYCEAYVSEDVAIWFHRGLNDFTGSYTEVTVPYNMLVALYQEKGYTDEQINALVKQTCYSDEEFKAVGTTYYHGATGLMCQNEEAINWLYAQTRSETDVASFEKAANGIILPKYDEEGTKVEQHITDTLKSHLDTTNLVAAKDREDKTLTVDVQLKDVFLTSDYINGVTEAGISYYTFMNYYIDILQIQQLTQKNAGYTVIDNQGNEVDADYIDELVGLLTQINDLDPKTDLKYDWSSAYDTEEFLSEDFRGATDVIATSKEGNVTLEFHIDSHSWWGYDLGAHDSITGIVMGYDAETAYNDQHDLTMQYGNFFVIEMGSDDQGTWYMINGTDLENPMIYVSKDGKEAFMIDVDFYGAHVLNSVIKSVIGPDCEDLKIFLTHNHGDHCNNLAVIAQDEWLKSIITIYWPENEPHTVLTEKDTTLKDMVGTDLVAGIDWKGVVTLADMEKFTAAGYEFQFIEIPDEHTPGGGQLADLTHKVIYSGDSLGAQVHLGGTTIRLSGAQEWYLGAKKAAEYIEENGIRYNIGAHTPYLNDASYASWIATIVEWAFEQYSQDALGGYTNVITEDGIVINNTERYAEMYATGLSDREELAVASAAIINNLEKVTLGGTYSIEVTGDDWGSGVSKAILTLDEAVESFTKDDIIVKENKTYYSGYQSVDRTVTDAYLCDENGNKVDTPSQYVAVELYISPSEGSPIIYSGGRNNWIEDYTLSFILIGELTSGETTYNALDIADEFTSKVCDPSDKFELSTYTCKDGTTYSYASYAPAEDDTTNALIIWLHGGGEGGTDATIPLLANEAGRIADDYIQKYFDGAYVLEPQAPTAWMDGYDYAGEDPASTQSIYTESLMELIEAYVEANPDIDTDRIYIGGCSNGGYMTLQMIISYPDYFAAAFPICTGYVGSTLTTEQAEAIKDIPMFFVFAQNDTTLDPEIYSLPFLAKLEEVGATNVHVFNPADVHDTSGRFDVDGEAYQYAGHWSWVYAFNDEAYCDDCGVDLWAFLAAQTKATTTPDDGGNTPGTVTPDTPNTGVYNNAAYVAVAGLALAAAGYVALKKKKED